MLTNLIKNGKITTTKKRAQVLTSVVDHFFSKLLEISARYPDEKDAKRESIIYVKSQVNGDEGKKVLDTWLPKYKNAGTTSGFSASYHVGFRSGDAAPKILLKLL